MQLDCGLQALGGHMGTYTTNYNLFLPTVGEQGWGELVNGNFSTIDTTMKGLDIRVGTLETETDAVEERVDEFGLRIAALENSVNGDLNNNSVSTVNSYADCYRVNYELSTTKKNDRSITYQVLPSIGGQEIRYNGTLGTLTFDAFNDDCPIGFGMKIGKRKNISITTSLSTDGLSYINKYVYANGTLVGSGGYGYGFTVDLTNVVVFGESLTITMSADGAVKATLNGFTIYINEVE